MICGTTLRERELGRGASRHIESGTVPFGHGMNLDDEICLCFRVTKRKLVNFIRVEMVRMRGATERVFRRGGRVAAGAGPTSSGFSTRRNLKTTLVRENRPLARKSRHLKSTPGFVNATSDRAAAFPPRG